MNIVIATIKSWNIERAKQLQEQVKGQHTVYLITEKEELTVKNLEEMAPDYIFFPHWSFIIPDEITQKWECVVFHMTDLPFGRGGSPLQNLIVRGYTQTKVSAIRVTHTLDGGPIFLKAPLSLEGTAQEILVRCADIVFETMIPQFLEKKLIPKEQTGEPVVFKRRKPEDGMLSSNMTLKEIYDYIRMLDAEGYPRAYVELGDYRLSFEQADFSKENEQIEAKVIIQKRMEKN